MRAKKNHKATELLRAEISTSDIYHVPVLLKESVDALQITAGGVYADATFGGGGHSREILSRIHAAQPSPTAGSKAWVAASSDASLSAGSGHLYGFDQDADAMANIPDDPDFTFVYSNFRYMRNFMRYYDVEGLDGILADLGVSWHHFDDARRGFSFRFDAPLDMRMNASASVTAADLLRDLPEEELAQMFYLLGELQCGGRLAKAIVRARESEPIETTGQLAELVRPILGPAREKKDLARVFQALRMQVNHETDALKEMLESAAGLLKPGGRLVIITYHSLEDRLVKNVMKSGNVEGKIEQDFYGNRMVPFRLIGKPTVPSADEQARNPRSRSAKLRIAEKI